MERGGGRGRRSVGEDGVRRRRGAAERQFHHERRAVARARALHEHAAPVQLDEMSNEGKADSEPGQGRRSSTLAGLGAIEDVG